MSKSIEKLKSSWNDLLLKAKEYFVISDNVYNTFIKDVLKPIKFEKDTLYLEVPESGYISFLENRIMPNLRILIAKELSMPCESLTIIYKPKNSSQKLTNNENIDFNAVLKASGINRYDDTFENFIRGDSNNTAYSMSVAVAEFPGEDYNPLFIHSKTGLGKTHLLHAIAIRALKKNSNFRVLFTTCEKYVQEYVNSLQTNQIVEFKEKYRTVDMLLIDDIHQIAGKKQSQDDLFNAFNDLYDNKKQIVLSSDRSLTELSKDINDKKIDDRLITRFQWGVTCEMYMPDYETRLAILRSKENLIKPEFPIDNEVMKYIAQNVKTNIRELESCLKNVILFSKFENKVIDLDYAKEKLTNLKTEKEKKLTPERITNTVCDVFGLSLLDVCGPRRNREFVYARDIAIYLCRDMIKDITQEKIGEFFGRDHSTVINSCSKIESKLKTEKDIKDYIKNIKEKLLI